MTATTGKGSRAKGARWMAACSKALTSLGIGNIVRRCGEDGDDIVLLSHERTTSDAFAAYPWSVECKDQQAMSLGAWVDQSVTQAGPNRVGIVWVKRRGKPDALDGFIVMRASDFWERVA